MGTNIRRVKKDLADILTGKKKAPNKHTSSIQMAVADFIMKSLLRNTPVKTGKLAGGWTFTGGDTGRKNKTRLIPPSEILVLKAFSGVDIEISNHVDYAKTVDRNQDFVNLSFAELKSWASSQGIGISIS